MKIVHLASELAPVAKVGGLGDVLQGLSRALLAKGHQVEVILPKYDTLDLSLLPREIPVKLIESPFFERGVIYGCEDDSARFTFFCRAALDYLQKSGRCPDVIHLHDWHTAVAAPLLKEQYPELIAQCIFTIHNLAYQGECEESVLDQLGWKSDIIKEGATYNLMKGGILYADHVTTVSPNYAHEILTTNQGGTLQAVLQAHQNKFSGVLNGIDYEYWNPATDPHLPAPFSLKKLAGKKLAKQELRKRLSLAEEARPLVVAITRLVPQKGPELIKAALLKTLELGGQFILLGSALDEKTHKEFEALKVEHTDSPHVHLELTYNEKLSHLVFGGGDLFLVPSLFEPCGLTQMIAMHYGNVPLVRATGGLVDTVFDGVNGFSFGPPTTEAICETLERALPLWNTPKWNALIESGMEVDHSWDRPAEEYLKIYNAKARV